MAKIIIAGDCCLQGRVANLDAAQLASLYEDVKPIIQSADTALVNLETAVFRSDIRPIKKAGPVIGTDARVLEMIHEMGFTGVTLANNHFADYGQQGVEESLRLLDEYNLWHVGAGMNADEAAKIGYLQVEDKKIAVINACEHEFTVATDTKAGCNALDPLKMAKQIMKAKEEADYVIVIIHGGHEHYHLPSLRMKEMYRAFVDFGADAVVNHHQHCYSGYEIYNGKPIVYGLGNFFFDWPGQNADWNEGYMVKLVFGKEIGLELIPYVQNAEKVGIRLMNIEEKTVFKKKIFELNQMIADPKKLEQHLADWVKKREEEYVRIILPYTGGGIRMLLRMHLIPQRWLPEYMTEERKLLFKSLFQCESHQEIMNLLLQ